MVTKRKATEPPILSAPDFDVYAHEIPQPFGLPPRRNVFRHGETVLIFDGRIWQRVNVHSDEAKVFKRILSASWQSYRYYDVLLRQDLAAAWCATHDGAKVIQFPAVGEGLQAA